MAARNRRAVIAWILYDWAFGAFTTVVTTFVFATYYVKAVATDPVRGQAEWATMQAIAGVVLALLAVPVGTIADRSGRGRLLLGLAWAVMVASVFGLWSVRPSPEYKFAALLLACGATVAFELSTIFYNAMLPSLAAPARMGRLSMLAWSAGYGGGLICLGLALVVFVQPKPPLFGLDPAQAEPIRATALLAGAWLLAFGWPVVAFGPSGTGRKPTSGGPLHALRDAAAMPDLRNLLIARLLANDGLTTLFAFGGIFAASAFGLTPDQVILFGIGLNVAAGVGAVAFAFVEDRIGAKATVLVSLFALSGIGTALLLTHDRTAFWVLGHLLGIFVGPAQAALRSLMGQIAPPQHRSAYFGLFAVSGRVTAFLGPAALAAATAAFGSLRAGMAVIVLFLIAGALALLPVRSPGSQAGATRAGADMAKP